MTKFRRPATNQEITYLYDARDLLTKATLPGALLQTYLYDAAGLVESAVDAAKKWIGDVADRADILKRHGRVIHEILA